MVEAKRVSPIGSSFDDFLAEEGVLELTHEYATKAVFFSKFVRTCTSPGTGEGKATCRFDLTDGA